MVNYKCIRCGYDTTHKSKMKIHLERKRVCNPILNNVNLEDYKERILRCENIVLDNFGENHAKVAENHAKKTQKTAEFGFYVPQDVRKTAAIPAEIPQNNAEIKCKFCNKTFLRKDSLPRHLKTCKEKKKDDEEKNNLLNLVEMLNEQMKEQSEQMKKKDEQMKKKDEQITELIKKAGIQNSNITQNIQQNIKLVAYKETDMSHLTEQDYLYCLNRSNMCIPNLIKKIHFNPKKPENHNIYISNIKNKYVMIYDGKKWNLENRNDAIDELIDNNESVLEQQLEEWIENGKQYPDIMKKFNRYLEKKEKDTVINKIKEEIKLILFNNRKVINNKQLEISP